MNGTVNEIIQVQKDKVFLSTKKEKTKKKKTSPQKDKVVMFSLICVR
jgi:hypothetical protein